MLSTLRAERPDQRVLLAQPRTSRAPSSGPPPSAECPDIISEISGKETDMAVPPPLVRRTGYVTSQDEDIYFEDTGEGLPVVLCHGLGGNHAIWWRQVEDLASAHRLVTWDQRGFGNSTARSGEIGPAAARRDLGALLDHLDLGPVALVGQSMGGWVALGYAAAHPERVGALIL